MKKLNLIAFATLMTGAAFSQNTFPTTAGANAGWGITSPNFNLQIHGTTNYQETVYPPFPLPAQVANYGVTSRLGLTNTTTGSASTDGLIMRMSGVDFLLENQEQKKISLVSNSARFILNGTHNRVYVGAGDDLLLGGAPYLARAYFNVTTHHEENGMYIQTKMPNKYGLAIKVKTDTDEAIRVFGLTDATKTFTVRGSGYTEINVSGVTSTETIFLVRNASRKLFQIGNDGIMRSREIIVDNLNNWPDYVFKSDYKLMSLEDVSGYISEEGHLPNVPSAAVVEAEGINVAQMNQILMEKVEELTLYLIEQNARIKELETAIGQIKE